MRDPSCPTARLRQRAGIAVAATWLLLAALPAVASSAVVVQREGAAIVAQGTASREAISLFFTGTREYQFTSPAGTEFVAGAGCVTLIRLGGDGVECPSTGVETVVIRGGDGADILNFFDGPLLPNPAPVTLDGEGGNDNLSGRGLPGRSRVTALGGGGNDQLELDGTVPADAGPGDDKIQFRTPRGGSSAPAFGGPGNDTFSAGGSPGRDVIDGGEGNDSIDVRDRIQESPGGPLQRGDPDLVQCGPGTDQLQRDAGDRVSADCEAGSTAAGQPVLGKKVVVSVVSGIVRVRRPGRRFVRLRGDATIPVNSEVDTSKGRVGLTSAVNTAGATQSADFYDGRFVVRQAQRAGAVTDLRLSGALNCGRGARVAAARKAAKGRRLWGDGKGNFRTKGRNGSATVRGTIWLVEDRCDRSTFFRVRRGVVAVRDFVRKKDVTLRAGRTYTARPRRG